MKFSQTDLGKMGEDMAVELLIASGYQIIERNYRFGKGEIDIIALDPKSEYTAFIEVKTRSNLEFGHPVYGITKYKMSQIKKIAAGYLYERNIKEILCRFDVVTVLMNGENPPEIVHYVNAFTDL